MAADRAPASIVQFIDAPRQFVDPVEGPAEDAAAAEPLEAGSRRAHPLLQGRRQPLFPGFQTAQDFFGRGNDVAGGIRGGQGPHVGRQIREGYVDLMSHGRDDGDP